MRKGTTHPNDRFYVRNHGPTPKIDAASWTLRVEGPGVSRGLILSYEDLLALPAVSVTRALECAGNGRVFFEEQEGREAEGTPWRLEAVGVAEWTGVPLRHLLEEAGLEPSAVEVMPEGLDEPRLARPLPREKALAEVQSFAHTWNERGYRRTTGTGGASSCPAGRHGERGGGRRIFVSMSLSHLLEHRGIRPDRPGLRTQEGPGRGPQHGHVRQQRPRAPLAPRLPEGPNTITAHAVGSRAISQVEYSSTASMANGRLTGREVPGAGHASNSTGSPPRRARAKITG